MEKLYFQTKYIFIFGYKGSAMAAVFNYNGDETALKELSASNYFVIFAALMSERTIILPFSPSPYFLLRE
jgi:hypothetical protein